MLFFSNRGHIQGGHSLEEAFNGGFLQIVSINLLSLVFSIKSHNAGNINEFFVCMVFQSRMRKLFCEILKLGTNR